MPRAFSPPRLSAAMVLASAMLTACAGSPSPTPGLSPQATDPVVTTQVKTRTVCPAELDAAVAPTPTPAADAVVKTNKSGSDWIAAVVAWGGGVAKQLTDARDACHAAQALEQEPAP